MGVGFSHSLGHQTTSAARFAGVRCWSTTCREWLRCGDSGHWPLEGLNDLTPVLMQRESFAIPAPTGKKR